MTPADLQALLDWTGKVHVEQEPGRAVDAIIQLQDALRAQATRAEQAEQERDEARQGVRDTLWMAGRYADGRRSYAVGLCNDAREVAARGEYAGGAVRAVDGMCDDWPTLGERLEQAERERDDYQRRLADLRAEFDARTESLAAELQRLKEGT